MPGGSGRALLPTPAVFWACPSEEGTKFSVNPFDRRALGWDGLFGERTMFWSLRPEEGPAAGKARAAEAAMVGGLTVGVPVLDTGLVGRAGIEWGTVGVVAVGTAWMVWCLVSPLLLGRSSRAVEREKKKQ